MKTMITSLTLALLLSNCRTNKLNPFTSSELKSATMIPAGKTFELGGNNNGSFTAQVSNVGKVVVAVSERQGNGQQTALGQLRSGDKKTLTFATGSTAVFVNTSAEQEANLGLRVIGDISLKMGYTNGTN